MRTPPAVDVANASGLRQAIDLPRATALVVGTIIGASIFVQPSEITGQVPSFAGVVSVWLVAGVLTLFGALVCAELASTFPESGGVYVFLRESYSPAAGFLWGWAMFWVMHTGIIAAIAMIVARYAAWFVPMEAVTTIVADTTGLPIPPDFGSRLVACLAILVLSGVNYVGVRHGSTLQALFTAGKLGAIGLIIVIGAAFGHRAAAPAIPAEPLPSGFGPADFGLALVAGLFAFGGWHMVTYSAGETVAARRTIPRALLWGTLVVTACYIALNAVYLYVLPLETVAASTRVAADAADAIFGFGGGSLMSGLVVFSTLGALTGIILAGPRVYWAMARDGLVFSWLGAVHPRFHTPHRAIALQALWACVLVFTGTYRALFTRVIYTEWIFFGVMAIGLMRLRSRPGLTREYSIGWYPVVPVVFAISAFAIVVNQVVSDPIESLTGLGLVLVGLPVYLIWGRTPRHPVDPTPGTRA